jgi:hypothetical protein
VEKSSPKIWVMLDFFKELPKENNRPEGKNLPNLVTLKSIPTFLWMLS